MTLTLFGPADRRCSEYDEDMPADISSILFSNIGEIFAAVVVDSNISEVFLFYISMLSTPTNPYIILILALII